MPDYRPEADKIIEMARAILNAVESGNRTTALTVVLGELMQAMAIQTEIRAIPKDQRDEFGAEVWDAAIGNEPTALVKHVGFLDGDNLELVSDAAKATALAYFNRAIAAPAV